MKILINYADHKYKKTQRFNSWTGTNIAGFDKVYSFGPDDIDAQFYNANKKILDVTRGNGLWLWKPYFINRVLSTCNDEDIVFYCDSGSFFVKKIQRIIDCMEENENVWVSDVPLIENNFTKPSCFQAMECYNEKFMFTNQIQATFIMVRNCNESRLFIREWLSLCSNYDLISSEMSLSEQRNSRLDFIEHREDQSILSLLCKKKGILAHMDPSQRGKLQEIYYNSNYVFKKNKHCDSYRTVIFLHKSCNVNIYHCIKIMIKAYINSQVYKYRKL